jgi:DNA mismatch repair protein MLH1
MVNEMKSLTHSHHVVVIGFIFYSTHIIIHVEKGGLSKLTVTDDGCGIPKADLALAATRHATSKLSTVQDFKGLQTFGFRGEALASMSMVSRLTITSRTADSNVGYTQSYKNGAPTSKQPKPCARKPGTTISIQDLFYNVPHRKNTYSKRESDEYNRILQVVQYYAIHYAHKAAFCCERTRSDKTKTLLVDLNTSQLSKVKEALAVPNPSHEQMHASTKEVLSHIFDSRVESQLSHFEYSQTGKTEMDFTVSCRAYFSAPSYDAKTTKLVIFLNHRLVDIPAVKRSVEGVYSEFTKAKPILALDITVPGNQVDVNVHPSKRQVALMYQDEVCTFMSSKLREALQAYGQSFQVQSVAPKITKNPYAKQKSTTESTTTPKRKAEDDRSPKPSAKKKTPPSQLVRTSGATPVGAIEPFLVSTQPLSQSSTESPAKDDAPSSSPSTQQQQRRQQQRQATTTHKTGCPLLTADLSQPGAFATLKCLCDKILVRKPAVRPKKVVPTPCRYASVASLRKRVNKHLNADLAKTLREAYFVGVVSHDRSLIQCGEELVLINHMEMAKDLFYQLALARFGGVVMAKLGDLTGLNIHTLIAQTFQLEDDLVLNDDDDDKKDGWTLEDGLLNVNETNKRLAADATACLMSRAELLEDYYSIRIEKNGEDVLLTGLPVLLEGHIPQPHGLGVFLLRLATQVDWANEKSCFGGVCRELGNYYAMLPCENEELTPYIRHTLFPAISYLLLPSDRLPTEGFFTVMTKLSTLYRVFERC